MTKPRPVASSTLESVIAALRQFTQARHAFNHAQKRQRAKRRRLNSLADQFFRQKSA